MLSSVLILLSNPRKRCNFAEYEILIRKVSCFMVRVKALFMSSTTYASTKGGLHFLDHKVTQTPQDDKKKAKDVLDDKLPNRNNVVECTCYLPFATPQWGAADAEMKVPSGENTELKRSPFKVWSRSVYSHARYIYCQVFLPYLFLPFRSIHLHFFQNLSRFFSTVCCG